VSARKRTAGKSAKTTHWLVYRIGGARGATLGYVKARDEAEALVVAILEFAIEPRDHRRIVVRPMDA
jgi:hypothetical protein